MSMDYGAIATEAAEVLAEVGGPCTLIHTPRAEYDPATSSADPGPPKRYDGVAVRTEYSIRDRETGLVEDRDCKLILGAVDGSAVSLPEPKPGDEISFAGITYEVVRCDPLMPAGVAVIYTVQARVP